MTLHNDVKPEANSALQFGHSVAAVDDGEAFFVGGSGTWPLQFGHSVAAVDDIKEAWHVQSEDRSASIRPQRRRRG